MPPRCLPAKDNPGSPQPLRPSAAREGAEDRPGWDEGGFEVLPNKEDRVSGDSPQHRNSVIGPNGQTGDGRGTAPPREYQPPRARGADISACRLSGRGRRVVAERRGPSRLAASKV